MLSCGPQAIFAKFANPNGLNPIYGTFNFNAMFLRVVHDKEVRSRVTLEVSDCVITLSVDANSVERQLHCGFNEEKQPNKVSYSLQWWCMEDTG